MTPRRLSKPAPPHNYLMAPAVCGCVECSRKVLTLRCPFTYPGGQCGDYKGHRPRTHTMLVATSFLIAAERVALDG